MKNVAAKKAAAASFKAEATNRLRSDVRSKAAVYLATAAGIDPDTSLIDLTDAGRTSGSASSCPASLSSASEISLRRSAVSEMA